MSTQSAYLEYHVTAFICLSVEKKSYGCSLPGEEGPSESQFLPSDAKGFMFAPKDTAPWQFEGKDDLHGIGYSGMQEQSVLGSVKTTKALYGMSGEVGCDSVLFHSC